MNRVVSILGDSLDLPSPPTPLTPSAYPAADTVPADALKRLHAATALLLRRAPAGAQGLQALFIQRALNPRDRWSGHVGLPGGRRQEDVDGKDDVKTAVRETKEEVGIDVDKHFEVVCVLPTVTGRISAPKKVWISITCVVFLQKSEEDIEIVLDPKEVKAAQWVSISQIVKDKLQGQGFRFVPLNEIVPKYSNPLTFQEKVYRNIISLVRVPAVYLPFEGQMKFSTPWLWGLTMKKLALFLCIIGFPELHRDINSTYATIGIQIWIWISAIIEYARYYFEMLTTKSKAKL